MPAGSSTSFVVHLTVPGEFAYNPGTCKVINNASIMLPVKNAENSDPATDIAAPATDSLPCEPTDLKLTKSASDCIPADPHYSTSTDPTRTAWICNYVLTLKNNGPAYFYGPATVNEYVPNIPGLTTTLASGCAATSNPEVYKCTFAKPLAPNDTTSLNFSVTVPGSYAKLGTCKIVNQATIVEPVKNMANFDAGNDSADATAKIPLVGSTGVGQAYIPVACDPPSLSIAKAAIAPVCGPSGDGYDCTYDVTVTSTGTTEGPNDPYTGALEVGEHAPGGTQIVSWSAPWSCDGTDTEKICTYPLEALPIVPPNGLHGLVVGDTRTMQVVVHVPGTLPDTSNDYCSITNTATITVAGQAVHADHGEVYEASAWSTSIRGAAAPTLAMSCVRGCSSR